MFLNRISLIGFTGREAEVRSTQNGKSVTTFSLATSKRFKDKAGNYQTETQWHRCVVYGSLGNITAKLEKGAHVMVEGELRTREYERDIQVGKKTVKAPAMAIEVIVRSLVKLDRPAKSAELPDAEEEASEEEAP